MIIIMGVLQRYGLVVIFYQGKYFHCTFLHSLVLKMPVPHSQAYRRCRISATSQGQLFGPPIIYTLLPRKACHLKRAAKEQTGKAV